ncbi:MAG: MGMT family protein [Halobacteriota archaeon]
MDDAGVYARRIDSLGRVVQLGVASGQVIDVSFPDRVPDDAASDHEYLDRIERFLDGERDALADVPIALTVPTDARAVLEALREVPPGRTITIDRLAQFAGLAREEDAHRIVRDALRSNPVPLILPDHRVRDGQGATPPAVGAALRRRENEIA